MTRIRLLAIDIDGTLLDGKWKLSDTNLSALRQTHERGVRIAFVTGRRYHITLPITRAFDFPHFVVTTAGATTRSSTGEQLFAHTMDPKLVREFLQHILKFRAWTFLISDVDGREDLLCEAPGVGNRHVSRYVELNENFLIRVNDLTQAVTDTTIEVVLIGLVGEMREAANLIDEFPLRHCVKVLRTEYADRDLCLLDVVDSATDKGRAVRQLAESLGIPREAVMAIGDNHSDIDMLAYAGCPVVMGNATAELKSVGWPITASNDEDGVARAIERFIFATPGPS